jgi:hypothetical protein
MLLRQLLHLRPQRRQLLLHLRRQLRQSQHQQPRQRHPPQPLPAH